MIRQTGTPHDGRIRRGERAAALALWRGPVAHFLARPGRQGRVEDHALVLSPLAADKRPARAEALADLLAARLPQGALRELVMEGDPWPHFAAPFGHAAGAETLRPPLFPQLYASLLAPAGHIGLEPMAHRTDRSSRQLAWCPPWYLREETRKAAVTPLVHSHHARPCSQVWGSGVLSSADGQRWPVSGQNRHARVLHPPLGDGPGLTFSRWSADPLSQDGSQPGIIPVRASP